MDPLQLGVFIMLVRWSWNQTPPCTIPASPEVIAGMARIQPHQLTTMGLLWQAWQPCPESQGRFVNAEASGVFQRLSEEARNRRDQRSAAGRASAQARAKPQAGPAEIQRPFNERSTAVQRPLESAGVYRVAGVRAPGREAQERKTHTHESERTGAPEQTRPALVGAIVEGLDARAEVRLAEVRRGWCEEMLTAAFGRWEARRVGTNDIVLIGRIARHPNVTPALVEIAIQRIEGWLDKPETWHEAAAMYAKGHGRSDLPNAVGYLIKALGCKSSGGKKLTPQVWDQPIVNKWLERERKVFDGEKAKAAMVAVIERSESKAAAAAQQGA